MARRPPAVCPASSLRRSSAPPRRATASTSAFIGLGNQSTVDLPAFLQHDDVQVVAVCDVNTASHGYRTPRTVPRPQAGPGRGERLLRQEDRRRPVQGLRRLQRFPRSARTGRRRCRGDHRSRPLARDHDRHGGQGGQRHLLRKAAFADRPARTGDGQGGAAAQAGLADRKHVPFESQRPLRLRVGPQRPHRASSSGS